MIVTNDLEFLENFFSLAHLNAKKSTQMAFINADWPPAPLPARRTYRPEGRAYASESAISKTPLPNMRPGGIQFSSMITFGFWIKVAGRKPISFRRHSLSEA